MTRTSERTVLIVDDNPAILNVLARQFGQDYRVRTASDGHQAISAIRRRQPDLVLLDIQMPGVDGMDVLRAMMFEKPDLRVIMLSGVTDTETYNSAINAGARAYFTKPFSTQDLKGVVEHVLGPEEGPDRKDDGRPWHVA